MDNIVRKPTRAQHATQAASRPVSAATQPQVKKSTPKWLAGLLVGLAILLLGLAIWWLVDNREPAPMSDRYQAVFLDDGKVFFGRLDGIGGDYLTLNEAYYTQSQATASDGETELQPTGGVNLIKVGDEIYGPENSMVIRADQVLFWQNLTTDNQIVKAIENQKD